MWSEDRWPPSSCSPLRLSPKRRQSSRPWRCWPGNCFVPCCKGIRGGPNRFAYIIATVWPRSHFCCAWFLSRCGFSSIHQRTGFYFGNPEYLRYNLQATLSPLRIVLAVLLRLWHTLGYLNMFVLTLAAAYAMGRPPLREPDGTAAAPDSHQRAARVCGGHPGAHRWLCQRWEALCWPATCFLRCRW